jgi:hypothetical protein
MIFVLGVIHTYEVRDEPRKNMCSTRTSHSIKSGLSTEKHMLNPDSIKSGLSTEKHMLNPDLILIHTNKSGLHTL